MTRHKIGIPVGSLRQGSINRKIALSVAEFAKGALDCRIIEIGDLPLYNEDDDTNPPPQYKRFRDEIASVDGILFCTPNTIAASQRRSRTRWTWARDPMDIASGTRNRWRSSARHRVRSVHSAPIINCASLACS